MRIGNGPGLGTVETASISRLLFLETGPMWNVSESFEGLLLLFLFSRCSFEALLLLLLVLLLSMCCSSRSAWPQHRPRKALVMENGILRQFREENYDSVFR